MSKKFKLNRETKQLIKHAAKKLPDCIAISESGTDLQIIRKGIYGSQLIEAGETHVQGRRIMPENRYVTNSHEITTSLDFLTRYCEKHGPDHVLKAIILYQQYFKKSHELVQKLKSEQSQALPKKLQ